MLRATRKLYRARSGDLIHCINASGNGGIEAEYARRVLRVVLVEWNLMAWAQAKHRKRAEVYRALDAAIAKAEARRGGWQVTGSRAA